MKNVVYNILKGTFLVSDGAYKKWRLILFFSSLAIMMIASSHSADRKVHHIAKLNEYVKSLRSLYVNTRSDLMELRLESVVRGRLKDKGIVPSKTPPVKILIASKPK
jgi:hypothetical protein